MQETNTTLTSTDTPPELWSIDDIALFYRRSRRTAQRIVKRTGFPSPTPADPGRWVAQRVIEHALTPESTDDDVLALTQQPIQRVTRRRRSSG
jgi:hypothetical protein